MIIYNDGHFYNYEPDAPCARVAELEAEAARLREENRRLADTSADLFTKATRLDEDARARIAELEGAIRHELDAEPCDERTGCVGDGHDHPILCGLHQRLRDVLSAGVRKG